MRLRQDRMSSEGRIDALLHYRKPDRVPIGFMATTFSCRNAGYTVTTAYDDPQRSFYAGRWTCEQYGWDPVPHVFEHTVLGALDFGGEVRFPTGEYEEGVIVKSYPVRTESDVYSLTMPDPKTAGRIPKVLEFCRIQEQNGLPVWFFSRSPFTMAANLCGLEQFLRWIIRKPELCERLIRLAIEHIFSVLQVWMDAFGPEKTFVYMSSPSESNQVISPKHFETFALPYHAEYHERLRSMGTIRGFAFHICGDQNLNLPSLSDLPLWPHPSVLSFGHEVDLALAAELFPRDIIFGNIEPAVIQVGTPQKVYDLAKVAIQKGKNAPGGFILGPGCRMSSGSPPVNVFAMTRAVNDFGWYE